MFTLYIEGRLYVDETSDMAAELDVDNGGGRGQVGGG
jgi:hypothetical protein